MTLIKDGLTNLSARVTSDFELAVRSRIQTGAAFASEKGDNYILTNADVARRLTIPTTFDGPLMFIRNLSTVPIFVSTIVISANLPGMFFYLSENPTVGTIGAATPVVPDNLNLVSAKKASAEAFFWDNATGLVGITGLTNANETTGVFIPGPTAARFAVDASLFIPQNGIFLINGENLTGGDIDVTVSIRFFFERPRFVTEV